MAERAPTPATGQRLDDAGALWARLRPLTAVVDPFAVDLDTGPTPEVITAVLAACTDAPAGGTDSWWDLTVGQRIAGLIRLCRLQGSETIPVPLRCPDERCREPMEADLTVAELLDATGGTAAATLTIHADSGCVTIRFPTGRDQRAWLDAGWDSDTAATRAVVHDLILEPADLELTDEWITRMDDALAQADRLLCCTLTVECGGCGKRFTHAVDVAELALRQLAATQRDLLAEVHELARQYHWREADILALPAWRREQYLAMASRVPSR